ncbi:hypothetical protein [Nocardioides sp. W7]|uniref:hypothetical protein n=1 Tax=Nocardioides sp. W7 TaxID=2931390 RepID=UPI001FD09551|nr:hypothetical protein [Nocardioides sp. W7]
MLSRHHQIALFDVGSGRVLVVDGPLPRQIYRAQPADSRWELATVVGEVIDRLAETRAEDR